MPRASFSPVGRHFPLEPLLAATGVDATTVAAALGVSGSTVHRRRIVGLNWREADRYAVAAGLHPADVWGDLWWETNLDTLAAPAPT